MDRAQRVGERNEVIRLVMFIPIICVNIKGACHRKVEFG